MADSTIDLTKRIKDLSGANKKLAKDVKKGSKALENLSIQLSEAKSRAEALASDLSTKMGVSMEMATKATKKQQAAIKAQANATKGLKTRIAILSEKLKEEGLVTSQVIGWKKLHTKAMKGDKVAMDKLRRATSQVIAEKRREKKILDNTTQSIHAQKRSYAELFMVMKGGKLGVQGGVFGARNLRNIHAGGAAFSVLRSKLLLASFAFGLLNRGIVRFVELAGKQQEAERKVSQAILSTGGAANISSSSLFAYAKALQSLTTFGDEAILSSSALLLTFKEIKGDTFKDAQSIILDVASAMGQDLKTSTIQVGKALNDPIKGIGALGRVGIQFTKTQRVMIQNFVKTGQEAKAQAIILKELESQFGGMAMAISETAIGSIDQMKNAMGDLGEVIGEQLQPLVLAVTNSIKGLAEGTSESSKKVEELLEIGAALLISFVIMPKLFKASAAAMTMFASGARLAAISMNLFKMALIKTGIGAIAVGLGMLIAKFIGLNDIIGGSGGVKENLGDVIQKLKDMSQIEQIVSNIAFKKRLDEVNASLLVQKESLDNFVEGGFITEAMILRTIASLHQERRELEAKVGVLNGVDEQQIKNNESIAVALEMYNKSNKAIMAEMETHIHRLEIMRLNNELTEDEILGLEALIEKYDKLTQSRIKALTLEEKANLQAEAIFNQHKEARISGYLQLTEAALNYYQVLANAGTNEELRQLAQDRKDIQNSKKSSRHKQILLDENDKAKEVLEKKTHNRSITMQQLSMAGQLFGTIAQIKLSLAIANAKATAMFLGPAALPVIAANTALAAFNTKMAIGASALGIAGLQAQRLAEGGDFITSGPEAIVVGDNPGGRERVQVTPLSSDNIDGPQGGNTINITIAGNVMSQDFIEDEAIPMIKEALRRGADIGIDDHIHAHGVVGYTTKGF